MTALARALSWFIEPEARSTRLAPPSGTAPSPQAGGPQAAGGRPASGGAWEITCAAVLGRPGEAEPVAAALALALGRVAGARAASVIVLGAAEAEPADPATGGTRAGRRLGERLRAHGLPARPRGRIVWVRLPAEGDPGRVRRAALAGAPAVLAVTVPRTATLEPLLAEQDLLLLVTGDPDGPLARLTADAHRTGPVLVVRPLGRGPARSLASGGVLPARSIRELLAAGGLKAEAR